MSVQQILSDPAVWLTYELPKLPKVIRTEILAQLRARMTAQYGRAQ